MVKVTVGNTDEYYTVVPVSYDEYARLMMRPYKYPAKGQVWRLVTNAIETENIGSGDADSWEYAVIELIGNFPTGSTIDYRLRYVRRPEPIILEDLADGLSIDGNTSAQTCLLPEHLHDEILLRAVELAKAAWVDTVAPPAGQ